MHKDFRSLLTNHMMLVQIRLALSMSSPVLMADALNMITNVMEKMTVMMDQMKTLRCVVSA